METTNEIRTRFAPSPTGYLHIGGARTALYCYLLAKKHGGKFILRIEDTDRERSTPEAIRAILDGLAWLGLKWDEGPYFQTERFELYNRHLDGLISSGKAYPCFCTEAELSMKREKARNAKVKYRYDRTCFRLSDSERRQKLAEGIPHCVRFHSSDEGKVVVDDKIKGRVEVEARELDDLVIRRTDGSPTYNFTVVVDDALMGITHVIRGDDHLNNTPRQIRLYEALGFKPPEFAHCSMILGDDRQKLSKRHGATGVMAYREMGYLPRALLNYLVRLGWSHGDKEIFTVEEMVRDFSLEAVNSASAVFNTSKLQWLNGHYIRSARPEDLAGEVKWHLERLGAKNIDGNLLVRAIKANLEKVKTLLEMAEFIDVLFMDVPPDADTVAKTITVEARGLIERFAEELAKCPDTLKATVMTAFETVMKERGVVLGKVANPARVALSGKRISPGVFELIDLFGKEESLRRLARYRQIG